MQPYFFKVTCLFFKIMLVFLMLWLCTLQMLLYCITPALHHMVLLLKYRLDKWRGTDFSDACSLLWFTDTEAKTGWQVERFRRPSFRNHVCFSMLVIRGFLIYCEWSSIDRDKWLKYLKCWRIYLVRNFQIFVCFLSSKVKQTLWKVKIRVKHAYSD